MQNQIVRLYNLLFYLLLNIFIVFFLNLCKVLWRTTSTPIYFFIGMASYMYIWIHLLHTLKKKTTYLVAQQGLLSNLFHTVLNWIFVHGSEYIPILCLKNILLNSRTLFIIGKLSSSVCYLTSKAKPAHLRSSSSAGYPKRTWLSIIMFILIPLQ